MEVLPMLTCPTLHAMPPTMRPINGRQLPLDGVTKCACTVFDCPVGLWLVIPLLGLATSSWPRGVGESICGARGEGGGSGGWAGRTGAGMLSMRPVVITFQYFASKQEDITKQRNWGGTQGGTKWKSMPTTRSVGTLSMALFRSLGVVLEGVSLTMHCRGCQDWWEEAVGRNETGGV